MEYQEIKDWLDRIVIMQTAAASYEDFNSSIQAILLTSKNRIQLHKGIEIVADIMGLQLNSREWDDGRTDYFFTYSGLEFFQIRSSDKVEKSSVEEGE